ncbi:MAG: alpha-hydroxy acid oxidase, partial [Mesorhizobium sp.]
MMRRPYTGRDMARILSVDEMRAAALKRLPALVAEYLEGGAEDEITLARNRDAFAAETFRPRLLRGQADPDMSLHGARLPLAIAPTGFAGLFAPGGDVALARAAKAAGVPMCQSTVSNATLEEIAPVLGPLHWMQVYVFRSRPFMEQLLERCRAAGIQRLVLTLDSSIYGNREWDRRSYTAAGQPRLHRKVEAMRHPRWLLQVYLRGLPTFGNLAAFLPEGKRDLASATAWSRAEIEAGLDRAWFDWLRANWPGELWAKGVLRGDDARVLLDAGADGIVVSNHGGRQLDGAAASLDALAEVAAAARGAPVWLDSGV